MTKLSGTLTRRVSVVIGTNTDGTPITFDYIVTLTADGVMMREAGRRQTFGPLTYGYLHQTAAAKTVAAERTNTARRKRISRSLI